MYDIAKRDRMRGWYDAWFDLYCELARCMLILFTGSSVPLCSRPLWVLKTSRDQNRQTMLPPIRADPVSLNRGSFVNQWTQRGRLPRIRDAWL